MRYDVSDTDQKVDNATEDDRGDGAQSDVRQDLSEEVDRHSVVATDVLVSVARKPKHKSYSSYTHSLYTDIELQR